MTTTKPMTAFERIHSDEPSVFAEDFHFRTSEYRKWLALDLKNPPTWPDFRDKLLAKAQAKQIKPPRGHAEMPLNLPGSRPELVRQK